MAPGQRRRCRAPSSECAGLRADVPLRVHGVAAQWAAGPPRSNHLEGALRERAGRADRDAHPQRLGRLDREFYLQARTKRGS